MFCGKCGAQISEGAKFCGACGAAVEATVLETPVAEAPAVEMPQAPVMEAPVTQTLVAEAPALGVPAGDEGKKKKGKGKKIAILAVCAVVAVAVIAGAVLLLSNLRGGKGAQAFFYLDQKGRLQYMADTKESTEPQSLGGIAPYKILCSDDGTTWYIWEKEGNDNLFTLYAIPASAAKQGDRPQRVSRNTRLGGNPFADNKLLYTVERNGRRITCCYDGEDSFELARDIGDTYSIDLGKNVLYYAQQSDGVTNYYMISIEADAEPELLKEAPRDETAFYRIEERLTERTRYDYVTDDLADADAALLAQELTEPQWHGEYYPESTWMLDGVWYYTDEAGINREVDVRDYMNLTAPGDYLPQFFAEEAAYDTASKVYQAAWDEYQAALEQLDEAQRRELLREELKESVIQQVFYDVYLSADGGNAAPVATGVTYIQHSSIPEILFYQKTDSSTVNKVVDIDELAYADDIRHYMNTSSADSSWYVLADGTEHETGWEAGVTSVLCYTISGHELVLQLETDHQTRLESWTVDGDQAAYAQTLGVTSNSTAPHLWRNEDGDVDALYFMTDVSDRMGTLCRYRDGEVTELADSVYTVEVFPKSGAAFVLTDRNSQGECTLLRMNDKGKTEEIADGVVNLWPIDEDTVLYKSDDDLYCWDGRDSRRIAKNVSDIWTFPQDSVRLRTFM